MQKRDNGFIVLRMLDKELPERRSGRESQRLMQEDVQKVDETKDNARQCQ